MTLDVTKEVSNFSGSEFGGKRENLAEEKFVRLFTNDAIFGVGIKNLSPGITSPFLLVKSNDRIPQIFTRILVLLSKKLEIGK